MPSYKVRVWKKTLSYYSANLVKMKCNGTALFNYLCARIEDDGDVRLWNRGVRSILVACKYILYFCSEVSSETNENYLNRNDRDDWRRYFNRMISQSHNTRNIM